MLKHLRGEVNIMPEAEEEEVDEDGFVKVGVEKIEIAEPVIVDEERGGDVEEDSEPPEDGVVTSVTCSNGHEAKLTYDEPYKNLESAEESGFVCNSC